MDDLLGQNPFFFGGGGEVYLEMAFIGVNMVGTCCYIFIITNCSM